MRDFLLSESFPETTGASLAELLAEGQKLFVQRRLTEAERCFVHAVALDPNEPKAHFGLGRVRLMQGDDEAALPDLRTAVKLDGSSILARRYLAVLLTRRGFKDESLALFRMESSSEDGRSWIRDLTTAAMRSRNLSLAGKYA